MAIVDNEDFVYRKRSNRVAEPLNNYNDNGHMESREGQNEGSGGFRCITCNRGPPYTKKYAKNQCQTCYKKDKKFQRGTY